MTAFRPGDLAQVVPDGRLYGAHLVPGDLVEIVEPDLYGDGSGTALVTGAFGEPDLSGSPDERWTVHCDALRLVPADEQGDPSPAPSSLTRLITAAAGIAVAVLESRVSIERKWHSTDRTTYRIVIEEKA